MKKQILKSITGASCGILAVVILTQVWAAADAQVPNEQGLVGSWDVTVTPRDCDTGAPEPFPPPLSAVQTYHQGGTMLASVLGAPGLTTLEGHGIWEHTKSREYSVAFRILKFNPDGSPAGKDVIRDVITLDAAGDSYTSTGTVDILAPDGSMVFRGCATGAATRFH